MPKTSAAPAETTPISAPASEQRAAPRMSLREAAARARAGRDPAIDAARAAANAEATALYGDDAKAALEAFAAGTHPLQRLCSPEELEATKRDAAASLARGPVDDDE